ncbi:MAG TPA: M1 family aminopeptidase [Thermoanaerobaculia bacterium]|nr:M1 family aminopeptidase [Thermoanaerobaculia bacterium]
MRHPGLLFFIVFLAAGSAARAAEVLDPAALQAEIAASHLEPARAVTLKNLKLNAGLATLHLDGLLVPASAVGGGTIEMVFLGNGRIELDPPDSIEAGQLELFTGGARLDAEFKEAVLVVGLDAAVTAMLRRPPAQPDGDTVRRAESLYTAWRGKRERKLLDIDRGILLDALHDPVANGYFAAWFRAAEPGDFLYFVEPGDREQVTLGRFVPLDATEKEKRGISREITRQQRKGRLLGLDVEDLGQWDTWLAASLRTAEGKPAPGAPSFEPRKYTLEMTVDKDVRLAGKARIDLDPVVKGSRAVALRLPGDFKVSRVTDAAGTALFFLRNEADLTVILPHAPAAGEAPAVVVEYAGNLIEKNWNLVTLLDTLGWYPHAGTVDRAAFDVTFHWPKSFDLVSSGVRMGGGEGADGTLWERRVLDQPSLGFSFEVGHFKVETAKAGHVNLRFAFSPGSGFTGRGVKEEVVKTVSDSLLYYEEQFGPYPLDEMTIVTANRGFSQGMLGFVTLSDLLLNDLGMWNRFFGVQDRRVVIAHEVAHQWWGNQVGWTSYRDQWISEAMASYVALRYAHDRLGDKLAGVDLNAEWQRSLTATLPDGRPLESVGPVVLGSRLLSSKAEGAYTPIVYEKGSVILDMLARTLGEENFPKVLKQVVKAANGVSLSTEDLISLIEKVTSTDLQPFAEQFVYGTGLPEVLYSYRFEKQGNGWVVRGEARQQAPHRFHYKVVQPIAGRFDVTREAIQQIDVRQSTLVVPVEISVFDPAKPKGKKHDGANETIRGNVMLRGESTPFEIVVEHEPRGFYLDRQAKVFGRFFDESRNPKRVLFFQAVKSSADGKRDEAAALFDQALKTEEPAPQSEDTIYWQDLQWARRVMNAQIELGRARLFLDQGKDDQAETSLDRARMLAEGGEYKVLQARLEVRQTRYDKAFRQLRNGLTEGGLGGEGYALLAVAARAAGHTEEYEKALKKARENGTDVGALTAAP